jgi:peptidyl-prolyl cis-trans isomerase SurA
MKTIKLFFAIAVFITPLTSFCQDAHTLVSIGDKNYSVEEFDFIYTKNNAFSEHPISKKEYIDLFVNYKLKVHEAIAQGFDTLPSFTKEFNYYKEELAKPYLSDTSITEHLKREAYERMTKEVNASHILIQIPKSATPADTLKAYNKISDILKKIKEGEDFNELATEFSEDPSAKTNHGRLGYFSGFMMVYPFESGAFNTPVGELSDIIRSSFGYHLIKVHDKRDNPGELKTAHIMMMTPKTASKELIALKKSRIDSIYQLIVKGEDFAELAQKFSEDRNSARNNGELPWFSNGRMIPEFSEPAFKLDSIGAISEVIHTPFGYHIIKLLDKKQVKPYEEMEEEITKRIAKDERIFQEKKVVIQRLKKEYNFQENEDLINTIKATAKEKNISDEDFFSTFNENNQSIASLDAKEIKTAEVMAYLKNNRQFSKTRKSILIDKLLTTFIDNQILDFEKSRLTDKYPEFRFLLEEYHDGLLIFDISQKEIWNRASEDSIGIANYYAAHKNNYFYPEKIDGRAIFMKDKKTLKAVKKLLASDPEISNDSLKHIFGKQQIKCINGAFEKGEYKAIDKQIWKNKQSNGKTDQEYPFVYATGDLIAQKEKSLDETKGQLIADYQYNIEKQWISQLKAKYNPTINYKALKFSKKALKKQK